MMETGLTRNAIISELSRSPHGALTEYIPTGRKAAQAEAEFLAHLIAWNAKHGQVRDSKCALPIVSLMEQSFYESEELAENSMAHLALLGPRELLRAYRFALQARVPSRMRQLRGLVGHYLHDREQDQRAWDRLAIQHRATLKEMYALAHIKPGPRADAILFKGARPAGSVFDVVARLKDMSPTEAAGKIMDYKIPFLIAKGALGAKAKEPDLVLALIGRMSPTELVTNTKMLERLGVKTNPALRAAYEAGLQKAAKSKANLLKTTRAAEAVGDEQLREKLRGVQEKQLDSMGVEGDWLVLGDCSGSMAHAIEVARQVAGVLAKMVKGRVILSFFNTSPQTIEATGLALDQIQQKTRLIRAGGGTSIGCGLQRLLDENVEVDGIAIVSDGGDNTTPLFHNVYQRYCQKFGKEVPVYLYHVTGDRDALTLNMRGAGHDVQVFELGCSVDFYSIPNLVQTMRASRYGLVDEIMATPLLRLEDVFKGQKEEVLNVAG